MGAIIAKIDNRIIELEQRSRSAQKTEELRFYSALNLEIGWFKNAWRNSVSRARVSYNEEEAKNILEHVGRFLQEVAKRPPLA